MEHETFAKAQTYRGCHVIGKPVRIPTLALHSTYSWKKYEKVNLVTCDPDSFCFQ